MTVPQTAPEPALSVRAARVIASASRGALPVTLVFVGHPEVVHGRVSFAHGARLVVRPGQARGQRRTDWPGRRLVLSLLVDGRAHALSGVVREVADKGVSIDLQGDLRGSDPRHSSRESVDRPIVLTASWGDHTQAVDLVDISASGVGIRLPTGVPLPPVDGDLNLFLGDAERVLARVRHCTMGPSARPQAVVGLAVPEGALASMLATA